MKKMALKRILSAGSAMALAYATYCGAYTLMDYSWGAPFESIQKELELAGKKAVFDVKNFTLVYEEPWLEGECKVSLVFTPKTRLLAGIACVWPSEEVIDNAMKFVRDKYGDPVAFDRPDQMRKIYIWSDPTTRDNKIILIKGPSSVILSYYGGEFYRNYLEESKELRERAKENGLLQ
ncbi:MAG: hypothetical protein HQL30_06700 [Candidatus Omnitrophica bacterium]|nr:hypothetical protein [Candidatus Omnitrophota bacterium]